MEHFIPPKTSDIYKLTHFPFFMTSFSASMICFSQPCTFQNPLKPSYGHILLHLLSYASSPNISLPSPTCARSTLFARPRKRMAPSKNSATVICPSPWVNGHWSPCCPAKILSTESVSIAYDCSLKDIESICNSAMLLLLSFLFRRIQEWIKKSRLQQKHWNVFFLFFSQLWSAIHGTLRNVVSQRVCTTLWSNQTWIRETIINQVEQVHQILRPWIMVDDMVDDVVDLSYPTKSEQKQRRIRLKD